MVDDPPATSGRPKGKGGRPPRAEASAKALLGVDLTAIDPVAILREIAADRSMPGSTRVAACRALIAARDPAGPDGCRGRWRRGNRAGTAAPGCPPKGELRMLCPEIQDRCVDDDDAIPVVEVYRGVGIEDQQPPERIELVRREIDRVHRMSAIVELADYAGDAGHPPEARMLAGARAEALWELAGEERRAAANQPGAIAGRDGRAWLPALA